MKKLRLPFVDLNIEIEENRLVSLVIENKQTNYLISLYLFNEFIGKEAFFLLTENGKEIPLDECAMYINNLFDLNLNSKRNINALYKILKKMYSIEFGPTLIEIQNKAEEIVKNIKFDFDAELTVANELKIDDLFKIMDLRFAETDNTLLLRLLKYIQVSNELQKTYLVFINHLHDYLENDEIEMLSKDLSYKNISLVNIESREISKLSKGERQIIIDTDLCTIK